MWLQDVSRVITPITFFSLVLFRHLSDDPMEERVLGKTVLLQVCMKGQVTGENCYNFIFVLPCTKDSSSSF